MSADGLRGPARTLLIATSVLGALELVLYRGAAPVLSHAASGPAAERLSSIVGATGELALNGTAFLIVLGALALVVTGARGGGPLVAAVAVVVTSTLLAAWTAERSLMLVANVALASGAVAVTAVAFTLGRRMQAAAVGTAAVALIAGRVPLLLDGLDAAGRGAHAVTATASIAEAAYLLVPPLLALSLVAHRSPPRVAWLVAAGTAVAASATLAAEPYYTAIMASWTMGITLSLPPALYVLSVTAAALVLTGWLADRGTRHLAVGLVLLFVAGIEPRMLHHNITAIVALLMLATPAAAESTFPHAALAADATTRGRLVTIPRSLPE